MEMYIVVPKEFVAMMAGAVNGNVEFAARQTNDGRWVCAAQSAEDFKADFSQLGELEMVELSIDDFPNITI